MTTYIVHLDGVLNKDAQEVKADRMGVMENGTLFFEIGNTRTAAFSEGTWLYVTPKP